MNITKITVCYSKSCKIRKEREREEENRKNKKRALLIKCDKFNLIHSEETEKKGSNNSLFFTQNES